MIFKRIKLFQYFGIGLSLIFLFINISCEPDIRPNPNKLLVFEADKDAKSQKGGAYWKALGEYAGFNDLQVNSIRLITVKYDALKQDLPRTNGVPDRTQIQKINKDKTTELVRLLGEYKEYRKIKAFDKIWRKERKNKRESRNKKLLLQEGSK